MIDTFPKQHSMSETTGICPSHLMGAPIPAAASPLKIAAAAAACLTRPCLLHSLLFDALSGAKLENGVNFHVNALLGGNILCSRRGRDLQLQWVERLSV